MQKNLRRKWKKGTAIAAAFALTVSGITVTEAEAASKWAPKLSATDITLKKGETKKISIIKKKAVKVKKVTWKIDTGSKKVKVMKKTKTYIKIKALKTGNIRIKAKIKTNKGTFTRKAEMDVIANKKATPKPEKTEKPDETKAPDNTETPDTTSAAPSESGNPSVPDNPATAVPDGTKAPDETKAPDDTETPDETKAPDETKTPDETKAPDETTAPSVAPTTVPSTPDTPVIPSVPSVSQGQEAAKSSWNKGMITSLTPGYAGSKVKVSLEVRESGVSDPSGSVKIDTNYNGYPTLATAPLSTEWTPVSFEYRFNGFTNGYPAMYFNGDDVTDAMTMYYRNLTIEVIDGPDPLGGTCLPAGSYHKGILASLRVDNNPKYYENKQVAVSFSIRVTNLGDAEGSTCGIKSNYVSDNPTIQSGVPLTTDWSDVSFTYNFGEITDNWGSLYLENTATITSDMEVYVKDVTLTVLGDVVATPTPEPTATPSGISTETITVNKTATIAAGTAAYAGFTDVALDNTVTIQETDTVKAKIKVCYDGETDEQTSYSIQFGFYTGDNTWSTKCFITSGLKSGTETALTRGDTETGELTVKGFKIQSGTAVPAGKDLIVTLEEIIITHTESAEEVSDDYKMEFSSWENGMATYRGYSSIGVDTTDGYFWYQYGGSDDKQWESGYYGYPVIKVTLPTGKTLADYDSISLDYKSLAGDANYKTVNLYIVKESADATGGSKPSISTGTASTSDASASWKNLTGFSIAADKVAADLSDLSANTFWVAVDPNCGNAQSNGAQTKFGIDNLTFHAKSAG